ncbi:hypothetical protein Bca52824_019067 [Brassica carinata]|uniref:Uncharacterized protein n=1 Tax=Brassica carinata TaxID=52824 RepID=A0A8X7VS71_BRACI|nr:hypothetical protein Bca52824_019067 [Brassica carinata]
MDVRGSVQPRTAVLSWSMFAIFAVVPPRLTSRIALTATAITRGRSLKILSYFVTPCFLAMSAFKIWWYASGASQIPFLGNVILSDTVACLMDICSWLYRTTMIFLVCVLFRLICHLQILRLQDLAQVFQMDSDVGTILTHFDTPI